MMESSRGPGVIGMLLALVVMAIFVMLFIFAFDEKFQGGGKSIESVIADQAREINDVKTAISEAEKQLTDVPAIKTRTNELAVLKRENQSRASGIEGLVSGIESAKEQIASLTRDFEAYKDKYRAMVRGKAKGETMERLETRDGKVYLNVTVREVSAIGIQIMHDGGLKRVPYEQLAESMVDRFQFDAKQKAAAIAKEEEERAQHDSAVSTAKAAETQGLEEKRKTEAEARKEAMARDLAVRQSRIMSMRREIDSLENAIQSESLKSISRAPQMRIQLAKKQRELSELEADVARMRAEVP
jgi:hypothetical protein